MITELENKNRYFIEENPYRNASILRIKSLFKVYGLGRSFIKFYTNETGEIIICIQDNVAFLHVNDESYCEEAAGFLTLTVNEIMTEIEIPLQGFKRCNGNIYSLNKWENVCLDPVTNDIQSGYNVLSKVFTDSINSTTYNRWYTDLSHRIRHNMSKIYTYSTTCSATAFLFDSGTILISQLATIKEARNQGLARKMLYHIATDLVGAKELLVLSQDEKSNEFYEKIGFLKVACWYCYER